MKKQSRGPTREQCSDEQWSAVCNFFDTCVRIVRAHRERQKEAA